MNICLVINSKVKNQTILFLNSLFINNKESFNIYVLSSDLTIDDKNSINSIIPNNSKLTFITVDNNYFKDAPILWNTHSKEAYYKLLIPVLIPKDVKKIIYFDIDIIINNSIEELNSINLNDYYFAACSDYFVNKKMKDYVRSLGIPKNKLYFNSGVMVFNLEKIRKTYKLEDGLTYIKNNGKNFKYHDQEVLNALYNNKTLIIDNKYNCIAKYKNFFDFIGYKLFRKDENVIVIHYAGIKPWNEKYVGKFFEKFILYSDIVHDELKIDYILKYRKKHKIYLLLKLIKNILIP